MGHKEPLHALPGGAIPADHAGDLEPAHGSSFGELAEPTIAWEHAWIDLGGEG